MHGDEFDQGDPPELRVEREGEGSRDLHVERELEGSRDLHVELERDGPPPVRVPFDDLAPDTLQAVIESFVLREGTDYGERETALDAKVAQVMAQLQRGDAHVVFDPATETVTIVRTRELDARVR